MSGSVNPITHAWFTGVAAVGTKVETAPMQFTQPVVMQGGMATQVNGAALPVITALASWVICRRVYSSSSGR